MLLFWWEVEDTGGIREGILHWKLRRESVEGEEQGGRAYQSQRRLWSVAWWAFLQSFGVGKYFLSLFCYSFSAFSFLFSNQYALPSTSLITHLGHLQVDLWWCLMVWCIHRSPGLLFYSLMSCSIFLSYLIICSIRTLYFKTRFLSIFKKYFA